MGASSSPAGRRRKLGLIGIIGIIGTIPTQDHRAQIPIDKQGGCGCSSCAA
jgi:hypothetical protein